MKKADLVDSVQAGSEKRLAFDSHLKRYKQDMQAGSISKT